MSRVQVRLPCSPWARVTGPQGGVQAGAVRQGGVVALPCGHIRDRPIRTPGGAQQVGRVRACRPHVVRERERGRGRGQAVHVDGGGGARRFGHMDGDLLAAWGGAVQFAFHHTHTQRVRALGEHRVRAGQGERLAVRASDGQLVLGVAVHGQGERVGGLVIVELFALERPLGRHQTTDRVFQPGAGRVEPGGAGRVHIHLAGFIQRGLQRGPSGRQVFVFVQCLGPLQGLRELALLDAGAAHRVQHGSQLHVRLFQPVRVRVCVGEQLACGGGQGAQPGCGLRILIRQSTIQFLFGRPHRALQPVTGGVLRVRGTRSGGGGGGGVGGVRRGDGHAGRQHGGNSAHGDRAPRLG